MTPSEIQNLRNLLHQVNNLHAENLAAVSRLTAHAVRIGFVLHQIRATVVHGGFLLALAAACPKISRRTCYNYMQITAQLAQRQICNNIAHFKKLPPSQRADAAQKYVAELDWLNPPFTTESLIQHLGGKQLTAIYRTCGVKPPAPRPASEPDPDAVHAWLEQNQPYFLGIPYHALPEKSQRLICVHLQLAHPKPTPIPLEKSSAAKAFSLLSRLLERKAYAQWDAKVCQTFDQLLEKFRTALASSLSPEMASA